MKQSARTRLGILLILAGAAVPLAIVSVAYACGRLVSLHVDPSTARAGAEVTGFGRNYNSTPRFGAVTVRFNSRTGPILWQGLPDELGRISPRFKVPRVRPGYYTIIATQYAADGTPAAGTPGRDVLRVTRSRRASSESVAAAPWGSPGDRAGGSGGAPAALDLSSFDAGTLGAALLMLALWSGGGFLLLSARAARSGIPPARRLS